MQPYIAFFTDFLRIVFTSSLCFFAIETRLVRNGASSALRRFGSFMLVLAGVSVWFNLTYFDRRFNIVPWADLDRIGQDWNWLAYLCLLITLARLWLALRQR